MSVVDSTEEITPTAKTTRGQEPSSAVRNYGATFATEFSVMVAQVLLYKFAAAWLGQTGFSEYAVARRVLAFLQPITMLGLSVGLPRYIALADGRGEPERSSQYFYAAVLGVGGFTTILVSALLVWPGWFSFVFFGSSEDRYLLPPMVLMLLGMSLHAIVYAFFRGKMAVRHANALQFINNGVIPLLIFALFHKDVASLLRYLGLAWIGTTGTILGISSLKPGRVGRLKGSGELLGYGLRRLPGDFAMTAVLALPAIFTAHVAGMREAGFVAFGLAIVNMISAVFAPVGIVLLPKVSRAIGAGDFQEVHREIVLIRRMTLLLAGAMVILVELSGGALVRLYLGPGYSPAAPIIKVLVLGALPLAFFSALRSAIDAYHHRAINALNLIASLVLFLAGSSIAFVSGTFSSVLWAFAAALTLLALLTQYRVHKILIPPHPMKMTSEPQPRAAVPRASGAAESPEGFA
jgi:O-antigen/teichoic acid export membrane protein